MSEIGKALQHAAALAFCAYVIDIIATIATGGHW